MPQAQAIQHTVQNIPTDQLQPNPLQPRGTFVQEQLNELVDSIKRYGVLEPLVIAHTPAGFQIIAGERRWRAAKLAGLETVPAIVKETTPNEMLEMAIIENVQRVDLNPMDRATAFERLQRDYGLTTTDIAERIGKSLPYVSNSMRLLKLPSALQDGLIGGIISEGHARALASIEDTRLMIEAYKIILKENGPVRRAEDLARRMKAQSGQQIPSNQGKKPFLMSKHIDDMGHKLQNFFGDASKVKLTRSKRETKLTIVLKGDPEKTQEKLDAIMRIAE
jgi:ParB family chromosome partitioning protein